MSALGGHSSQLSNFATTDQISWSPDGRVVAAARAIQPGGNDSAAIYVIPIDGGEPRAVTATKRPAADGSPAFSADGRRLAYVSCTPSGFACDVYVINLDAEYRPMGRSRQLTSEAVLTRGLCWSRDDRFVIYARQGIPGVIYLSRVAATGDAVPERIEVAGLGAVEPSVARTRDRLAFTRSFFDVDIYRFQSGGSTAPVVVSSFGDYQAQFSPDGQRIAFGTTRSGVVSEIWVAAADGSQARQLTRGPGRRQGAPRWSPDGRRIVFNSQANDGRWHVWTIDVDGGPPYQITNHEGNQTTPSWSRDGRTIYYTDDQGMGPSLWRVPARGGAVARITADGSSEFGIESADGKSLLVSADSW